MLLKEIEQNTEDINYECEARLNQDKPLGWLKTICAFANSKGGILYVGVENKTFKLIGFEIDELDKEKLVFYHEITNHFQIKLNIKSEIIKYQINAQTRYILKFIILESTMKPVILKYDGLPLIFIRRDGYTSVPTYEEIRELSLESPNKSYDKQLLDIKFNEVDFKTFYEFYKERKRKYPTEKELGSIEFYNDDKYLYMGSFMFSDNNHNENTKIVCTRYASNSKGDDKVIDSKEYIGNLIGAYYFIINFINTYQKHGYIKLADRHEDLVSFPDRAVFEAVINALAHRDYFIDGSQINVDIFNNRLVITSLGSFYGNSGVGITYELDNVVSKRRNNLICQIFIYLDAMEARGTGFEKISAEYKNTDLTHKPYIFTKNNHFSIILPDLLDDEGVPINYDSIVVNKIFKEKSKYDYSILSFCLNKRRSVKDIVYELGISNSSYFRNTILENLVNEGLLIKEIVGKTTYYLYNKYLVKLK